MKKFNVIYFSDCRWVGNVEELFEVECECGKDVFERLIEMEMEEGGNEWVESISNFINEDSEYWVDDRSKWEKVFCIEKGLEDSEFSFNLCDELRSVLVIREDSKYFGKFKEDVEVDDEENVELYWEIVNSIW